MLSYDESSLPPFANETNKRVAKEIHEKESRLTGLLAVLDDNSSRADAMASHLRNVQQELHHTQAIYDAKLRQIETEEHFKQVSERECGRLALEIKKMEKEIAEITDQLNAVQNNIYRGNERIESIRAELKMEKEELDEWLRVQTEKEEDSFALMKYTKEDNMRIKELSLAIEKLTVEVNRKKASLSAEVTDTQVTQIELEKTTEAFRRLHAERHELIQQWENAIKTMQKRDEEILQHQEVYQKTKDEINAKQSVIAEKQAFLDQQKHDNVETEKRIATCDRHVSKYRLELTEAQANLTQFQNETDTLKSTVTKGATDLTNQRAEIVNLKNDLIEKQERLGRTNGQKQEMKEKLARVMDTTMTMEAKAAELEAILRAEEWKNKELDRELKLLREQQFKRTQELFRLKQDEKNLAAEITGSEAALKNLKGTVHKLDQEALKQQALLYAQEFQIQQLERKVRRAQGDRTDEEKEILLKKIDELNTQLEEQTKKFNLLNVQLKRSQEDLRQAKRKLANLQKEQDSVVESIEELNLYTESAGGQLSAKIKEKEELMVDENILRLELRKLRAFLNARADEVFTLETRHVQLHLALEERTKEIAIHNDMLRLQVKNAEEERHSASAELREQLGKVDKLRRRYEILMTQFAPAEDGGGEEGAGEEHSQAYYVIRAAQEREALQREGDELDAKIRKAEREIKALENTLKMMNDRNEDYRMNLYKAELNATDVQHKEMLEQQYRAAMERYKVKRHEIQTLQQALTALERTLSNSVSEESIKQQVVAALDAQLSSLDREVADQTAKRDRAFKHAVSANRQMRKAAGGGATALERLSTDELDFRLRECRDLGGLVHAELLRVLEQFPDAMARVPALFAEHNIAAPSAPISRVPSRAESVMSTASAGSSSGRRSSIKTMSFTGAGVTKPPGGRSGAATPAGGASAGHSRASSVASSAPASPSSPRPAGASGGTGPGTSLPATARVNHNPQLHGSGAARVSLTNLNVPMASTAPSPSPGRRSAPGGGAGRSGGSGSGNGATAQVGAVPTSSAAASATPPAAPAGAITGAKRIKKAARPGSAGSASSRSSSQGKTTNHDQAYPDIVEAREAGRIRLPERRKKSNGKLDPRGFALASSDSSHRGGSKAKTEEDPNHQMNLNNLKLKKSWDVALAPLKSIPMNAFMLYMSGNSVQIFSILVTVMLFWNAAKAMLSLPQAFEKFDIRRKAGGDGASSNSTGASGSASSGGLGAILSDPLLVPKLVFIVAQILTMGLGVYKCGSMGLLPTAQSDWLAFLEPKKVLEFSAGGIAF
ncbi:hypothetical protein DFJ73DRAFT_957800 [Zopfochytrium polystomum]|nr:hypothetical protein DFJ73DRAFT_957800 [Zopfochytrium polystomum]